MIRRWRPDDAPLLAEAIGASLENLRQWMEWAHDEPVPEADLVIRLTRFADDFDAGRDWGYAVLTPDQRLLAGGAGLHRTEDPATLEIGCWLRTDVLGVGLGGETCAALCHEAFYACDAVRVQLRCDPRNTRSIKLAKRLGFVRCAFVRGDPASPGARGRDALVFSLDRAHVPPESPVRLWAAGYETDGAG